MLRESEKLEKQIQALEGQLQEFPAGKIISAANRNGYKWYYNDGNQTKYLSKKERSFAELMAYKKYLNYQLEKLQTEKKAVQSYLNTYKSKAFQDEQSFIHSPAYKELYTPIFTPLSEELHTWMNSPYHKNELYPEKLIHKTYGGICVRSKSEALIAMVLAKNKIPFRYECLLELDDMHLFPDFTIRHPVTGEVYYWEHFGMMDHVAYGKKACAKLQTYISNGIIPTINLLTTYETKESPLGIDVVEKMVEHYFL